MPAIEITSGTSSVRELPKSWETCQHSTALSTAKLASDEEPLIAREYPETRGAAPSSEGASGAAARPQQRRWLLCAILLGPGLFCAIMLGLGLF